jgi:hypothetical protein
MGRPSSEICGKIVWLTSWKLWGNILVMFIGHRTAMNIRFSPEESHLDEMPWHAHGKGDLSSQQY